MGFPLKNNHEDLDPSYKTGLDFEIVFKGNNLCLIGEEIFVH